MMARRAGIVGIVVLAWSALAWAGTYGGGAGTEASPYQIGSAANWGEFMNTPGDWYKRFILTTNLDFGGATLTPVGVDGNYPFTGVFNGQGHVIRNAAINKPSADYVGLFGYLGSGGQIKNLGVEEVAITGKAFVGGLVGYQNGSSSRIENCYATGTINGTSYVGGLVGDNQYGTITSSHATGAVSGNNGVGGLVGRLDGGTVTSCYATGVVSGTGNCVGGLVGYNTSGTITSSYATGAVSGTAYVGGLVGDDSYGTITSCYATGTVNGSGERVGGLVGDDSYGTITSCYATGTVNGTGGQVGGLVGYNGGSGTITSCYATGAVTGTYSVGGLVGNNNYGTITSCYATGAVGTGQYVGGLVGENFQGTITSSYTTGAVSGHYCVGGLVGYNYYGTITSCYATGAVTGTGQYVGGLVGANSSGTITGSFWDRDTSGQSTSAGGEGKTTVEMKTLATFTAAGWNISAVYNVPSVWKMPIGDYPRLAWEDLPAFLVLSNAPESLSAGTGETSQFSFAIARREAGGVTSWTVAADGACPWISSIAPASGTSSSPEDTTTVCVTVDAGQLEPGAYPIRLLVNDGYILYEVSLPMNVFDRVDQEELMLLASYWLMTGCDASQPCSQADWYIDGVINLLDFRQLALSWLGEEMLLDRPGIQECFESGTFSDLPWQQGGNAGWTIVSEDAYEGVYAAQSGTITNFQTSSLSLAIDPNEGSLVDTISFARKVSSETDYDYLRFSIDGVEQNKWCGELDWAVQTFTFAPGPHTFKWSYTKDGSVSSGADRAWIDAVSIYKQP